MKPLKALLALAVAMTTTSSFAETANPLATFKQEAKTAINNELSSAKKQSPKLNLPQQPI